VNTTLAQEVSDLRPELHRFCTRMTGNPCDGEDVVQDTLAAALERLPELRDAGALRSWLFRIAHNRCIDLLRGRARLDPLDPLEDDDRPAEDLAVADELDDRRRAAHALTHLALRLPPRERACVVLKDVLDHSLEDTAAITGSSVGAVKAALHRGRDKLEAAARAPAPSRPLAADQRAVVERYLAAFNRRDWDGVRALLSAEARLEVVDRGVDRSTGPVTGGSYFVNYGRLAWRWRLALAWVDGVECVVHFREHAGAWVPHTVVQLAVVGDRIATIRDYVHVDYLLRHATVVAPDG